MISVIIPTLNEEAFVANTIQHLLENAHDPDALEVLVIDAGSTDATLDSIKHLPVRVITDPALRLKKYESLNRGIQEANGEIIQFLDADTLLPRHFDTLIRTRLGSQKYVGGGFNMKFDRADWRLKILSAMNYVRYHVWKTFYGDQAVFCRREVAQKVSGFPPTLMESAYFCRLLRKQGKLAIIGDPVISSSRRFYAHGIWKVMLFDIRMWFYFITGMNIKRHSEAYWKSNLENG